MKTPYAATPYYAVNGGAVVPRNVDGHPTTAAAISSHGCARAIALVYGGFGDGMATAQFIVRACNAHEELLAALRDAYAHVCLLASGQKPRDSNAEMSERLAEIITKAGGTL